ncbi:MAG: spermidine synthase, partial [Nitrospinota bacterium]|nr:spermidine synthase [Nitrospinota bacterium]
MTQANSRPILYWLYIAIFALSGFSGLIYESIWTHYLKLFLGSAAYAQTLVLAIFMGGMALGAWGAGWKGEKIKNLLLAYALVEGVIGIAALMFHPFFIWTTQKAYLSIFPALSSPEMVGLVKWSLAALMILPQSILLGATFPLMSAGIIRRFSWAPGESIAVLYFSNSLGASVGVLVSGFYLIQAGGLPGTILAAGVINILLALVVWMMSRTGAQTAPATEAPAAAAVEAPQGQALIFTALACAGLTGLASFLYEVGWIRMLNMVLGTSTHSFELMLSAFILGLALGGLIVRKYIASLGNTLLILGWVQLVMGALAMATIFIYGASFEFMLLVMQTLSKTDSGYLMFTLSSHAVALAVMLPATICAGMTLPLLTSYMLGSGAGEGSIGKVYAANTLGSIAGVALGVQVVMPVLGLKSMIITGAIVDMSVGIWLLLICGGVWRRAYAPAAALAGALLVVMAAGADFDRLKMISQVFRNGVIYRSGIEFIFHKDGKNATVDVFIAEPG